jgi:hypothetical protein
MDFIGQQGIIYLLRACSDEWPILMLAFEVDRAHLGVSNWLEEKSGPSLPQGFWNIQIDRMTSEVAFARQNLEIAILNTFTPKGAYDVLCVA